MDSIWIAVLLALAAALVGAIGTVLQQTSAAAAPHRGLRLLRAMIAEPRWLLGYALGLLAVGLGTWALAVGALLVVQPVGVASVLFALPLAARFSGHRMTSTQWVHAAVLAIGLAAFVAVGRPTEGLAEQPPARWLGLLLPMLGLVAALGLLGRRALGPARALLLALGTGILFGIQAALVKAVLTIGTEDELALLAVITSWELAALLVMSVTSVALQQVAFQAADLSASQPAITVLTPVSSALCGVVIFGETLDTTPGGWLVVIMAVLLMGWATIALARSAGARPGLRPAVVATAGPPA
jgi:drug/metabolite transporter (DMT)-like permease